jgi:hypothetical protein
MDDSSLHDHRPVEPVAGDDLLPDVEPPSAGFLVQLFVVPALIVLVVFSVWLLFSWLVHRGNMDPDSLIQGLQSSGVARWQRAHELADLLRNERFEELRFDSAVATQLAGVLDREIDAAGDDPMNEEAIRLQYFLCRALGEFRVTGGIDVLIKAATTGRDPERTSVRLGAIEAIAVRASNLAQLDPPQTLDDPELEAAMIRLAVDEDELIRSETAYALGRIGTPVALAQLETMVHDPHADSRYNAALALAQRGHAAAIDTLAEMLDPDEMTSVRQEENERAQFNKRGLIMTSALAAVETLVAQNSAADLSAVVDKLQHIISADAAALQQARIHPAIVRRAERLLEHLQRRSGGAAVNSAS